MSDSVHDTSTVETVLLDLAEQSATGCLVVRDPEGDEAHVYLREGGIYAVNVPGRRAMLGVRLVSSGALSPEALSEALEVQRTQLEGWRLGELLIHLGYVDAAVVEASVVDHMTDALADLLGRPVAALNFRKRKKTRQDTGPRTAVRTLFDDLRERGRSWEKVLGIIGSTDAAPQLPSTPKDDAELEANDRALLAKIDGRRSVADLAGECGFTVFEAGHVVVRLHSDGFLQLPGGNADTAQESDEAAMDAEDRALAAEAERRAAADRERAEAERKAEARRKAEAKQRAETERRRAAAEQRRVEAERAEALELQRAAAERKREQAERIRAAAAERDAAAARQRELLEAKRLEDAQLLAEELEALAAKAAAEAAAKREAEAQAQREAAEAAERAAAQAAALREAQEATVRRAAEEGAAIAQAAAERFLREDAEQRPPAFAAQASSLLTELNADVDDLAPLVPAQARGSAVDAPSGDQSGADHEPVYPSGQTDTAMLLRELSSLNLDGDSNWPGSASPPPVAPRRPASALPTEAKSKKRKGLFGRG